ncbi:hypothetical protein ES708_13117 [subsurface metagenome]
MARRENPAQNIPRSKDKGRDDGGCAFRLDYSERAPARHVSQEFSHSQHLFVHIKGFSWLQLYLASRYLLLLPEHSFIMIAEDYPVVLICPCNKYPVRNVYPGYLLCDSRNQSCTSQVAEFLNAFPLRRPLFQCQRS